MTDRRQPYYSTRDAVTYLRDRGIDIVPDTLRHWVREGRVGVTRTVGGQILYTRAALDRLVAGRREGQHAQRGTR